MSVFLIAASAGSVGDTVQPMIEAFPNVPAATIRLVTTIPSMTGMVMTFLMGLVAGKRSPSGRFASWAVFSRWQAVCCR